MSVAAGVDHAALFAAMPSPSLVTGPDLVIADVNRAFEDATGRAREDLVGLHVFEAFPDAADAEGTRNLEASLNRALATGEPDTMPLQRHRIPGPDGTEERWWALVNVPVPGADGRIAWIVHQAEDVTPYVTSGREAARGERPGVWRGAHLETAQTLEAKLYARARELQRLNAELRRAHARERQVALTLQRAMLTTPDLDVRGEVAVRYLPATRGLSVGGDWYDVVDLPPDRFALAVGDVVGHGLEAAAAMGMLRSALSAAMRAVERPAPALEVLGLYAGSLEAALNTTVVEVVVDTRNRMVTYSSAGHPPPVLAHADGRHDLLDLATDPPLGVQPVPRPQANASYEPGDTLVLYTDGLIERHDEDIDAGLDRLTGALADAARYEAAELADVVLARLGVEGGGPDDIALVIARL
ncbi:SpoIIE family protein phosphatase [Actinomadura sp. NPDC048394]|uniref:PP2C family protein-serine/threonine phosphatase n=1 Tax=Actinomadura sp. NPDC048394 TaxID=3158223 RepID=UPI0033D41587